ncbi:MAG: choice-of-anchor tandem repeat GloVer-containing protein [Ferruginibacter sp.]
MKKILYIFILSLFSNYSYAQVQLYGLTSYGGTDNLGTIFHYDPATYVKTTDQSFIYTAPGGGPQYADLTEGGNNKFYGMTAYGGPGDKGVIFEWDPATNIYTRKVNFNDVDGANPFGSLTLTNGKFYGIASNGGANNKGVIFEWDPAMNIYSKKIDFDGTNGAIVDNANGTLVYNNGKFYGTTPLGGTNNRGVIFEWDPATNIYTKRIDFITSTGGIPFGSLTLKGGKFYGMTSSGGANSYGVIFEWDPVTNTYTNKKDFNGTDGSGPYGNITENGGKFYGMTYSGGSSGAGVIFEWDPATNIYTKKIDLNSNNGGYATGSLLINGSKFYGLSGGGNGGVIFEWDPATNIYIKKVDFGGMLGSNPHGTLVAMSGNFYGMTTSNGPYNNGVIFQWNLATNTYTKKIDFNSTNGSNPFASLTKIDSKLYGTTIGGGVNNEGTIFEFDPVTNTTTTKIDFKFIERGLNPSSSLTLNNGKFYGITGGGGAYGNSYSSGVIFEWDPATNIYINKVDLNTTKGWGSNGDNAPTFFGGKLYGVTAFGGPGKRGVIYEWDPVTNIYTIKFGFDGGINGGVPGGNLTLMNNKFYGITSQGGASGNGVIYEWDPVSNIYTKKIDFNYLTIGSVPSAALTLSGNKFYGMTSGGGGSNKGVIFEWDPTTNNYSKKIDFDGANGSNPQGSLLLSGTKFYGTTNNGGSSDAGVIFEWDPATNIYTKKADLAIATGDRPAGSLIEFNFSPLPLNLLYFKGQIQNTSVQLNWQTSNEINASHFIVQRSGNGSIFNNLGRVEAKNISGNNDYSLTDASPFDGINFYRLQMVDIDGKITYSSIIKIVFVGKNELQVFPNPAKNTITISGLQSKGMIKILAADGKVVKQLSANAGSILVDLSTLTKGVYLLQFNNENKTEQTIIIKQ